MCFKDYGLNPSNCVIIWKQASLKLPSQQKAQKSSRWSSSLWFIYSKPDPSPQPFISENAGS